MLEPGFDLDTAWRLSRRLRRHIREARRIGKLVLSADTKSPVRIYGQPVIGDLPERVRAEVGFWAAQGRVAATIAQLRVALNRAKEEVACPSSR